MELQYKSNSVNFIGEISSLKFKRISATIADLTGATATATNIIPDGAIVFGVTAQITTAPTGASTFSIGDGSDADKWGAGLGVAVGVKNASSDYTAGSPTHYSSDTSVVLTGDIAFVGGVANVEVLYATIEKN
jgi:hypothetical protein